MSHEVAEAVAAMIVERQQARTSEHAARATATAELRAWLKRRRDAGLKKRHTAKLAPKVEPEMLF